MRKAKRALLDMSTLSSERAAGVIDTGATEVTGGPALYDYASEDAPGPRVASGGGVRFRRPNPARSSQATRQQLEIDLGPGAQKGLWKLPPLSYLTKTNAQEVDHREVQARGRVLEESLASHGVETHLVGMTVGPTVTRYELELGAGRQGRPGHHPAA